MRKRPSRLSFSEDAFPSDGSAIAVSGRDRRPRLQALNQPVAAAKRSRERGRVCVRLIGRPPTRKENCPLRLAPFAGGSMEFDY
jgi:hypothetical protein